MSTTSHEPLPSVSVFLLFDAFVTSDFIESYFGCLKDSYLKMGKIDVTNVTGIGAAKKNHTFDTPANRLRTEKALRKKRCEEPMTMEEEVAFVELRPMAAFESLPPEDQERLYLQESKTEVYLRKWRGP